MHEGDLLDVGLRGPCWKQHPCSFHTAILNGNFALCERCDLVVVGDYHNRHFLFVEFGKRLSTDSLLICAGSRWAGHAGGCREIQGERGRGRASATRCCSPPESVAGSASIRCPKAMRVRSSSASASRADDDAPM